MKTNELNEALELQQEKHNLEHTQFLTYTNCIFCYPLTEEKEPLEFRKFWDWIQIQYNALICTLKTVEIFLEILNLRENKTNRLIVIRKKFRDLLQSITFEEKLTGDINNYIDQLLTVFNNRNNFKTKIILSEEEYKDKILEQLSQIKKNKNIKQNNQETQENLDEEIITEQEQFLNPEPDLEEKIIIQNEEIQDEKFDLLDPLIPINLFQQENMNEDQFAEFISVIKTSGQNFVTPTCFYGKDDEDPLDWLKNFNNAAIANDWDTKARLKIVRGFLKNQALNWYEDERENIEYWKDNSEIEELGENDIPEEDHGFEQMFTEKFVTREKINSWYQQLEQIEQDTTINDYIIKFKKIMKKIGKEVPDNLYMSKFYSGLKEENATKIIEKDPETLEQMFEYAKNLDRAQKFKRKSNITSTKPTITTNYDNPFLKGYKNPSKEIDPIDELTRQMKDMRINLFDLLECEKCKRKGHVAKNCRSKPCETCNRMGHRTKDCFRNQTCQKCNRKGHTAEKCRETDDRINLISLDTDSEYESERNDDSDKEIFVTLRSGKTTHKNQKPKTDFTKKSESKKENKIKFKKNNDDMDIDEEKIRIKRTKEKSEFEKQTEYDIGQDLMNTKANITFAQKKSESKKENKIKFKKNNDDMDIDEEKIRIKRTKEKSEFEKQTEYDIGQDLMNTKANITFAQLLQNKSQKQQLKSYIKNTWHQELRNVSEETDDEIEYKRKTNKSIAVKTDIKINGIMIRAISDTGVARSVMSKALMKKLGLKIQKSSLLRFKLADESRVPSLGELETEIVVNRVKILIRVQILESPDDDLLLGVDWFSNVNAKIRSEEHTLKIKYKNRKAEVPILVTKENEYYSSDSETSSEEED